MDKNTKPEKWQRHRREKGPDLEILQVRFDWLQHPKSQKKMKRTILESNDWVNIIATTPQNKIVIVRQFRFGTEQITTEIPGGIIDKGEDSKTAAIRELKEETGYTSSQWKYLGAVETNPAFMNNLCHSWHAKDVALTDAINLDEGEDITVTTLTLGEIRSEIQAGTFRSSLPLLALTRVFNVWNIK